MRIYNWNTVQNFFDILNKNHIEYVVMRNYENMHKDNFFEDGHEDIDILCENVDTFVAASKVFCKMVPEDDIHFVTFIAGTTIPIDLRHQGDQYYDNSWERDILSRRKKADNGNWYVMSDEDYYYSLVYHVILQKSEVNPQYIIKLNTMAKKLDIQADNKEEHLKKLDEYMRRQGYRYIQPEDASIPFQWKYIEDTHKNKEEKKTIEIQKIFWGGGISVIAKTGLVSIP